MQNFAIREQIRDYWALRAETYDLGRGHGIAARGEADAFKALFAAHLGPAEGRHALDLATGTGEIALLLHELGYEVTGVDFAEPMLERARAKAKSRQANLRFLLRDVETTHEPDAGYDVLVTRNLVWTLVEPEKAFAEWLRLLRPGGKLLIIDADHVTQTWADRLHDLWSRWFVARPDGHSMLTDQQWANHRDIVRQVHFSRGARAEAVAELLTDGGFVEVRADRSLGALRRIQSRGQGWTGALRGRVRHRFAISCRKPEVTAERSAQVR